MSVWWKGKNINFLSKYCLKGGGQIAESRKNLTIIMVSPYRMYIFGVGVEQFSYILDKVIRIPDSTFITSWGNWIRLSGLSYLNLGDIFFGCLIKIKTLLCLCLYVSLLGTPWINLFILNSVVSLSGSPYETFGLAEIQTTGLYHNYDSFSWCNFEAAAFV